jgi:hypothetical protein
MNLPKLARNCLVFLIVICRAPAVLAQQQPIMNLAKTYSAALRSLERWRKTETVETVVRKGRLVGEHLDEMESLSEEDYSRLEKLMKGFVLNREEILFIQADAKFFFNLSKKYGSPKDVAYFSLMQQIRPDNVWAAYIEQQTDVAGCTIYGNGVLTGVYGAARTYQQKYPKAYVKSIKDEIYDILDKFSDNICACGSSDSVSKEFRSFVKAYPRDKNTPAVRKTLKRIKTDKSFRFFCTTG